MASLIKRAQPSKPAPKRVVLKIIVSRGDKERPLSRVLPDDVWREEITYKCEAFWNSLREFGDVYWEIE